MSHLDRVDEATFAAWNRLAVRLREDLDAAGFASLDHDSATGVNVEVDPGNDPGGGVFVSWVVGPALLEQIRQPVLSGDLQSPAIRHHRVINEAMEQALRVILLSAGHRVEPANDEYRPLTLRVITDHEQL
ncbi:hypothetical protein ACIBG8_02505 [Nonomuraea sp. NPDC050556]|uniref:hypothetical protein n=1 Tax=Nonomuraea sp. NPDC050556 TaxID=3364369 RepID=UPI0037AB4B43